MLDSSGWIRVGELSEGLDERKRTWLDIENEDLPTHKKGSVKIRNNQSRD